MTMVRAQAQLCDFNGYLDWYESLSYDEAKEQRALLERAADDCGGSRKAELTSGAIGSLFSPRGILCEENWERHRAEKVEELRQFRWYATEFSQPILVLTWESGLFASLYIGNAERVIVVPYPERYLKYIPAKDFSGISPAQLRGELGTANCSEIEPETAGIAEQPTPAAIKGQLLEQEALIDELKQAIADTQGAKTGELSDLSEKIEALKRELQEKKSEALAELNAKRREMEQIKEQLETQIYLLDSQIYSILCYAGEVVSFAKIRSGRNAPDAEPIVVHQKVRFLDEDLARLASLYEIDWRDIRLFEEFLMHSPLALDTFAPNERCVMLVRLSRSARRFGSDDDAPFSNVLRKYEYYHGKRVGIIVRNGENIYLGWTDTDRIHIDDDLIINRTVTDISPEEPPKFTFDSEREQYEQKQREERRALLDGLLSRNFIYNILQGIVDNSALLPLPKGVTLARQSEHVIYSVADKWLSDNRYGGFTEIVARCNERIQKGDELLSVQRLVPEHNRTWGSGAWGRADHPWENVRGRGDRNRTHDCSVDDCTIYLANLVEYDEPVEMIRYSRAQGDTIWTTEKSRAGQLHDDVTIVDEYVKRTRHVYVSTEKTDSAWRRKYRDRHSEKLARANFEVHDEEIINLTYMNSVWLEYVVTNKSLGGWKVGGAAVDYAYAIRYLKTALDAVRAREANERVLLDAVSPDICKDPEWPVRLSEWKLALGVRKMTEFQARRFAKSIKPEAGRAV